MLKIRQGFNAILGAIGFQSLPKNQRLVSFYSEGENYWPHLAGILMATLKETDKTVCYISSSLKDPGLMIDHPRLKKFFIGSGFVRDYFFQNLDTDIMVMTMPDLDNFQVKRSMNNVHYIYVQHSLCSLHMIYRHQAFDNYDTICAAGPHHVSEIRKIEAKYNLPPKNVVEIGYSRLDSLLKTAKKCPEFHLLKKNRNKTVLVAPSWGPKGLIESGLGKSLVQQLLDLGHEVVLRPHPQTIRFSNSKVNEIRKQHQDNSLFSFECSVAGQESLHRSDIMVSDWSGVALEYAFALKKPVIFCDVPKKVNNPNYRDIDNDPIEVLLRDNIGVIWDGLSPLKKSVEHCIQKSKNDLSLIADRYCFNMGYSDLVFVEYLKNFK